MRIMLDTMIYDALAAHPDCVQSALKLIAAGRLTIITTHIQEDQIAAIPDAAKRETILQTFLSIQTFKVATHGAIWDVSRWDECTWGDEPPSTKVATSGIVLDSSKLDECAFGDDAEDTALDRIIKGNSNHAPDALIGVTASSVADALVTRDKQLTTRIKAAGIKMQVWSFEEFARFLGTACRG